MMERTSRMPAERHPLEPFLPDGAKILMLGSFPPKRERWSMDFFYPNFNNDMWRIFGLVFFTDKSHFITSDGRHFDKEKVMDFCAGKGIALYDTACEVIRLKDNASDKFLEIVSPTDIAALLSGIPSCRAIVTTGQKAAETAASALGCQVPDTGSFEKIAESCLSGMSGNMKKDGSPQRLWRLPSSSRAYPLPLEKKAEVYRRMFEAEGLI